MSETLADSALDKALELFTDPEREREWVEAFLNVPSEDEGIVPWTCTAQQTRIIDASRRARRLIIIKGRQTRCSTILMAKAVRRAVTSYGQNFVIITQTDVMTQNFRQFIKDRFADLADKGFSYEFEKDNDKILRLGARKNTFHFASAESKVGLRGIQTAHWVHASEVAHWPEDSARRIIGGLLPAVPPGGFFVAESTPNGADGWFYKNAMNAMPMVPSSLWTVAFFPWWLENKYTAETYRTILADMGLDLDQMKMNFIPSPEEEGLMRRESLDVNRMLWRRFMTEQLMSTGQYFAQEYPEDMLSCWLASGVCFFQDDQFDHLAFYRGRARQPMQKLTHADYRDPVTGVTTRVDFLGPNLQIFEAPAPGHSYVAFQDASAGVSQEGDYSALTILDVSTPMYRQVATVRVRTLPGRVGAMAAAACQMYNTAFFGFERNTYGISVYEKVMEMHYPSLFYDVVNQPNDPKPGWYTGPQSREIMLNRFRERVFNHSVDIIDQVSLMEMGGFTMRKVQGRGGNFTFRAEAEQGNDDMVISLAGACAIAPYAPLKVGYSLAGPSGSKGAPGTDGLVVVDGNGVVVVGGGTGRLPWLT